MLLKKKVSPNLYSYFKSNFNPRIDKWDFLRELSKDYPPNVNKRLEWIIFFSDHSRSTPFYYMHNGG